MRHVWKYQDAIGIDRIGLFERHSDFGGTDVTYWFHRLGDDGMPIVHDNGGRTVDGVSGSRLKAAQRIGAVKPGEAFKPDA